MRYNGNKFSVYESEEKTVLGLIDELGSHVNSNTDNLKNKTDINGDHKGSWQGLSKPTLSEEGMRATVEQISDVELPSIKNKTKNIITLEELGAVGDGVTDDIQAFNKAMELMIENKINKVVGYGVYAIGSPFNISNRNDITFEIDTLIPTRTFPQEQFLLNVGKTSNGSMANLNIKINLLDGKNIANGIDISACGSSTFDIKTGRNCTIFAQIDNPSKICSDNVFIGNNIRQCGFGFIFRSENMSACEGQMIKYNFTPWNAEIIPSKILAWQSTTLQTTWRN